MIAEIPRTIILNPNFFQTSTSGARNLAAEELKDPKPTLTGNVGPAEKRRPHGHTAAGRGKNPWPPL
jgi:hypothetical protein